jgi:hypothetical protein
LFDDFRWNATVETDPTLICELLARLEDIAVLGVEEEPDERLRIHIQTLVTRSGGDRCGMVSVPASRARADGPGRIKPYCENGQDAATVTVTV